MKKVKTLPTNVEVEAFLALVSAQRKQESDVLIAMMRDITGFDPVMWGPSIIGFGSQHFKYDTGREGDVPQLGFSPRRAAITIYFAEGFDRYGELLAKLGKYKASVSCLYINKLDDVNRSVLRQMLEESFQLGANPIAKPTSVEEYIAQVPASARAQFDELRLLIKRLLPNAQEVLSYGIVGYKIDDKRARVFISGWKDHVAMYPIPKDEPLQAMLNPYAKGKGTLWFSLTEPLPVSLIEQTVQALAEA